jgi:hypothetical protein
MWRLSWTSGTHIWESWQFELIYTMQGKTRSTWHARFPCQSTYARCTFPVDSPRTWQPFTSHRRSWTNSLLLRKRAPDTIHSTSADRYTGPYPVFLLSQPMKQWRKPNLCRQHATKLTEPISPTYDRYVQYLLTGVNSSVLNRHRRMI